MKMNIPDIKRQIDCLRLYVMEHQESIAKNSKDKPKTEELARLEFISTELEIISTRIELMLRDLQRDLSRIKKDSDSIKGK